MRRPLNSQVFRQLIEPGFAGTECQQTTVLSTRSTDRADVDDAAAAAAGDHRPPGRARAEERSIQIDTQGSFPALGWIQFRCFGDHVNPCVVDENVDPAEFAFDLFK